MPCKSDGAKLNFATTVSKSKPIGGLANHMTSSYADLSSAAPSGSARFWGVSSRTNGAEPNSWSRVETGDYAAFSADKRLFTVGTILRKFQDKALADHLWGTPPLGSRSYEYLLMLDDVYKVDVDATALLRFAGKNKVSPQDFWALKGDAGELALEYLGLTQNFGMQAPSGPVPPPSGPTDRQVTTTQRAEQAQLADYVMSRSGGLCAICGRNFHRSFLVTAHIKLRANCSDTERLDFDNVAMAACKLGCDALYEAGFIGVNATGTIVPSFDISNHVTLDKYFAGHLQGRKCLKWDAGSAPYFQSHWDVQYRQQP